MIIKNAIVVNDDGLVMVWVAAEGNHPCIACHEFKTGYQRLEPGEWDVLDDTFLQEIVLCRPCIRKKEYIYLFTV